MYLPHKNSPHTLNYCTLLVMELSLGLCPPGAMACLVCSQRLGYLSQGEVHFLKSSWGELQLETELPNVYTGTGRLEHSLISHTAEFQWGFPLPWSSQLVGTVQFSSVCTSFYKTVGISWPDKHWAALNKFFPNSFSITWEVLYSIIEEFQSLSLIILATCLTTLFYISFFLFFSYTLFTHNL